MHGDLLLVVLVLVLGCAAFFVGVIYMAGSFVAFLVRGLFGLGRVRTGILRGFGVGLGKIRVCPRERCRKVERRAARFCSQCGAPLRGPEGGRLDAYVRG